MEENVWGLVPASLPHAVGYACAFYAPTSPPPRKRGVEFKGNSLHDGFGGFDGFGGSGEHLALLLLVLRNTVPRDDHDGFDGFGGFGG